MILSSLSVCVLVYVCHFSAISFLISFTFRKKIKTLLTHVSTKKTHMYKYVNTYIQIQTHIQKRNKHIYTNSILMSFVGFTLLIQLSFSSFFFLHLFFFLLFFLSHSISMSVLFSFFLFDLSLPCFDFLSSVFLAFFFFHTFFKHFTLTFLISSFSFFSLHPLLSSSNLFFLLFSFCFLAPCLFYSFFFLFLSIIIFFPNSLSH